MAEKNYGNIITPQIAGNLSSLLKEHEITCLFVDTFIRTNPLDENDNTQMGRLLVTYEGIAKDAQCGVVLIHHLPKGIMNRSYAARGASAITDNARSVLLMQIASKGDAKKVFMEENIEIADMLAERLIEVTHTKHNYSVKHPKQYLMMAHNGILLEIAPILLPTFDISLFNKARYKELYAWWTKSWEGKPLAVEHITKNINAIKPPDSKHGRRKYTDALQWAIDNNYAEKTDLKPADGSPNSRAKYYLLKSVDKSM